MSSRPPRRTVPGTARVSLANTAVVVLAALITAALALVVEDALAKPTPDARVVASRLVLLGAALVLLGVGLWLRSRIHRTSGTLFHIHLLDSGMRDRRHRAVQAAATRRMSTRAVIRWVDLTPGDPLPDISADCAEIGRALEALVNNDRDDTGHTVAPNLLWPAALAIGAYLPAPAGMRLLELPPTDDADEIEFALDHPTTPLAPVTTHDLAAPTGDRIGVWLRFTQAATELDPQTFADYGVRTVHTLTSTANSLTDLDRDHLAGLGHAIAQQLAHIKKTAGKRELVLIAMIPKTVALTLGWHLARTDTRFFPHTHLLHYTGPTHGYTPLRVHPTQPTHPPRRHPDPPTHIRNLTPHKLVITTPDGTLDPSGVPDPLVGLTADVTDAESTTAAVDAAAERFGGLDVLVNNAGIGAQGTVETNPEGEWLRVYDVNVLGIVRATRAALPHLRRSDQAAIVNTCSIAATAGLPNRALYSATKGAVLSLTLAMAADHVGEGIRVNCVNPGTVDTPWVRRLLDASADPDAELAALRARQPLGRLVTADEVPEAIAYLAGPHSASTTGTALAVDGGMHGLRLRPKP
ncbi:hypothetical protein GCM10023148_12170 [Actinokineospora soli]